MMYWPLAAAAVLYGVAYVTKVALLAPLALLAALLVQQPPSYPASSRLVVGVYVAWPLAAAWLYTVVAHRGAVSFLLVGAGLALVAYARSKPVRGGPHS